MTRRIAIVLPNWVGDAVMATPAIRAVRDAYPNATIVGFGRQHIGEVLCAVPWLDEFVAVPKGRGWFRSAMRARQDRFDEAILFSNSFRSTAWACLAGIPRRIGFARHGRDLLLTERLYSARQRDGCFRPTPIIDDYLRLAKAAGASYFSRKMQLFTTTTDDEAADIIWRDFSFNQFAEIICLNPGAAFGSAKLWPAEYFTTLARDLIRTRRCGVLVLCGPAERELAQRIAAGSNSIAVRSLSDAPVSLGLTKACIRRADALVTTDSGPRHIGVAFSKPVVTLFGPTHRNWTRTFCDLEVELQVPVPCGPCQLRRCSLDHRCMRELTPKGVLDATVKLLERAYSARTQPVCHAA